MKRTAAALALLVAAGCGGGSGSEDGRTTIEFWHSFVSATRPALAALIEEFEADHPDIRVRAQYVPTGDGLIQKLVAAVGSGKPPDIAWVHSDFLDKLVLARAIWPMSRFIDGPDGYSEEEMADFFPQVLQNASWRDTLYALPMEATSLGLMVNRDLFRKVGLDPDRPPATWGELREYARMLTIDDDGDGRPETHGFFVPAFPASGSLNIWMVLQWTPFLWQAGGFVISEDQSEVLFDSEAGVAALTLWRDIHAELGLEKASLTHDLGFASQRLAMVLDGPWSLPRYRDVTDFEWGVAPLPAGPAGPATYLAGEHLAIFRKSEKEDAAWTFARWVTSPEVQARFSIASGYLPVRRSTLDLPEYVAYLETDPPMRAFVEQMAVARARRPIDFGQIEINRNIATAIERALIGHEDPALTLREAADASDAVLAAVAARR
jgi:ABC-type glycerol-3-phosphate transport system substrate-binding protein